MTEWVHVFTIIGVNIAVLGIFAAGIFWVFGKLDSDIKNVNETMNTWMRHSTSRMDQANSRTDQLYQMFVDLQREMKDEIISMKKEHYEFMKEKK
ncbi:hypothetical protein UFOVP256_32 [uncultured Caudovirales phage]|uniref:Uncharacterized protein n=1 Tax=uncultured Caudovirales phage TaxID=2100421 RepID=A0A6J5LFJ3_9CAUD|nr:hypothetical protein UFOVP256_32 [uncultured Caudovirales phage]